MIAEVILLVLVLISLPKIFILLVILDMVIWIITYKLTMKWLDYVYVKTDYSYEVEFGGMVMAGFALWIPGIILLIDQIRTKSFRNYVRSLSDKSLITLLFR